MIKNSPCSAWSLFRNATWLLLTIVFLNPNHAFSQAFASVSGKVTSKEDGESIPGVNVVIKGTTIGTVTDIEGNYNIEAPDENGTLVFSYIGYVSQEVQIQGRSEINLEMMTDIQSLDEAVVIGYGTQQRSDLTGSVSSVRAEEFQGQSVSNIEQALQGRVPGVEINASSGEPGAPMQVRIRGMGTFGDTSPLYVIDGVPIKENDMNMFNPNNIQSIEILKDASAAAIYGARAANGVIIITTKSGRFNAGNQITYNGTYGLQSVNKYIPLLNSQQYADLNNESTAASGYPPEPAFNDPVNLQHNTDWQREAFQVAPIQDHTLTISGGSENASYAVSGGYFDQEGVLVFGGLKRYSASVNTRFKIGDKLTIGESVSFSRTIGLNRGQGNNTIPAYLMGGSPTMRIYRPENAGGYAGPTPEETGINNRDNVIGRRANIRSYSYLNKMLGNAFAEYEILPGLQYRLNLGLNVGFNSDKAYNPYFEMDNRTSSTRTLNESKSESYEYLVENTLSYNKKINDIHSVSLLAGITKQTAFSSNISGSIMDFPSNELQVIDAGSRITDLGGNEAEWAILSYLARANLTFFEKYLFSATIRRDGSSRFGSDTKYGNFPSVAAGWIISRENFMQNIPHLEELKFRASWGQLGNQEIGNYVNQTTISTSPRYILGAGQTIAPAAATTTLGNPSLRWETTTQTDLGIDLELFNHRMTFSADYYVKSTEDILLRVPITVASGYSRNNGPFQNAASVKNSGLEFALSYKEYVGELFFDLSANLSTIKNEVTSLGGESEIINQVRQTYQGGGFTYTAPGHPMSSFYGHIMDGIFQNEGDIDAHAAQPGAEPGDIRFRDVNGDGVVDNNDRVIIGNTFPNFTYGFSASADFKGFDVRLLFNGVQGRDIYNGERAYLEGLNGEHNQMATTLNRWTGESTSTTMPRAVRDDPNDNRRSSTRFVDDASFLRLRNLQLGYTFPEQLINRVGMRTFRVYFNAQNLFTITKYPSFNPDVVGGPGMDPLALGVDFGSYPISRVLQLGLEIGF